MRYSFVGSKDMYCKWNVQYKHSCKTVQLVIMEHVIQISQVCMLFPKYAHCKDSRVVLTLLWLF